MPQISQKLSNFRPLQVGKNYNQILQRIKGLKTNYPGNALKIAFTYGVCLFEINEVFYNVKSVAQVLHVHYTIIIIISNMYILD